MHGVVATLNRGVGVSREAIGDQPSVGRRDLVPALEMDAAKLDGTAGRDGDSAVPPLRSETVHPKQQANRDRESGQLAGRKSRGLGPPVKGRQDDGGCEAWAESPPGATWLLMILTQ